MRNVTMFVWNNFINDARVFREGSTLSKNGYSVRVIAKRELDELHLSKAEEVVPNMTVMRPLKWELPLYIQNKCSSSIIKKHIPNALLMLKMILLARKLDTDIYHAHDLNTLIQGVVSSKLRKDKKILIYDSHEVQTSRTHYSVKLVHIIEGFLLKFVDHTIVENNTRKHYHDKLYNDDALALYNYSESYELSEVVKKNLDHYKNDKNDKIVLYQGGLQEGRGLTILIEAFKSIEDAVLILVGDGKEKENLMELTRSLNITNKVHFINRVPYKELRTITKSADIGIQFLENTNFNHFSASSNKLFEYIMAEVPVISSLLPELKAVVESENIGLLVTPGDKQALTEALEIMIKDDALRETFKNNTKNAKSKYHWNLEQEKLLQLYNEF